MQAIFSVSLVMIGRHKKQLLKCQSFESIMNFLKTALPGMDRDQMEQVFMQALSMDIRDKLDGYEKDFWSTRTPPRKTLSLESSRSEESPEKQNKNSEEKNEGTRKVKEDLINLSEESKIENNEIVSNNNSSVDLQLLELALSATSASPSPTPANAVNTSTTTSNTSSGFTRQRKISRFTVSSIDGSLPSGCTTPDLNSTPSTPLPNEIEVQLQKVLSENEDLKIENNKLLDQLHVANTKFTQMQSTCDNYMSTIKRLEQRARQLEDERYI